MDCCNTARWGNGCVDVSGGGSPIPCHIQIRVYSDSWLKMQKYLGSDFPHIGTAVTQEPFHWRQWSETGKTAELGWESNCLADGFTVMQFPLRKWAPSTSRALWLFSSDLWEILSILLHEMGQILGRHWRIFSTGVTWFMPSWQSRWVTSISENKPWALKWI